MDRCKRCGELKEICFSHAIPEAFFKSILRENNGNAILASDDNTLLRLSNNSGGAYLFCEDCEAYFNKNFDAPLVNLLRKLDRQIIQSGFKSRVEFDHDHLAQCFASIFWRMCVSNNKMYLGHSITSRDAKRLQEVFSGHRDQALKKCSVSFRRLSDLNTPEDCRFNQEVISNLVLAGRVYNVSEKPNDPSENFGMDMSLQGFLVHLVLPRLRHKSRRRVGFLKHGQKIVHAPFFDVFDYPPIASTFVSAYGKRLQGKMTKGMRNRIQAS